MHATTNKAISWHTHDFYSHKHTLQILVFSFIQKKKEEKMRDLVNLESDITIKIRTKLLHHATLT